MPNMLCSSSSLVHVTAPTANGKGPCKYRHIHELPWRGRSYVPRHPGALNPEGPIALCTRLAAKALCSRTASWATPSGSRAAWACPRTARPRKPAARRRSGAGPARRGRVLPAAGPGGPDQRALARLLHARQQRGRQQAVAGQQAAQVQPELHALARGQLPGRLARMRRGPGQQVQGAPRRRAPQIAPSFWTPCAEGPGRLCIGIIRMGTLLLSDLAFRSCNARATNTGVEWQADAHVGQATSGAPCKMPEAPGRLGLTAPRPRRPLPGTLACRAGKAGRRAGPGAPAARRPWSPLPRAPHSY